MMTALVQRSFGIDTDSMPGTDGRITARELMWSLGSATASKNYNHFQIFVTQVNFKMKHYN